MINNAFKTLEQIESGAFKWGTVLLVLSGSVLLFVWVGAIRPDAFGGYLKDGAFAVFAIACGLVVLSAARTGISLLVRGLTYRSSKARETADEARELANLRENARYFITSLERLILCVVHDQPSRRTPMFIEYQFFKRLIDYGFLKYEPGSGTTGSQILQLNELIADDDEFWSEFRGWLTKTYGENFRNEIGELVKQ